MVIDSLRSIIWIQLSRHAHSIYTMALKYTIFPPLNPSWRITFLAFLFISGALLGHICVKKKQSTRYPRSEADVHAGHICCSCGGVLSVNTQASTSAIGSLNSSNTAIPAEPIHIASPESPVVLELQSKSVQDDPSPGTVTEHPMNNEDIGPHRTKNAVLSTPASSTWTDYIQRRAQPAATPSRKFLKSAVASPSNNAGCGVCRPSAGCHSLRSGYATRLNAYAKTFVPSWKRVPSRLNAFSTAFIPSWKQAPPPSNVSAKPFVPPSARPFSPVIQVGVHPWSYANIPLKTFTPPPQGRAHAHIGQPSRFSVFATRIVPPFRFSAPPPSFMSIPSNALSRPKMNPFADVFTPSRLQVSQGRNATPLKCRLNPRASAFTPTKPPLPVGDALISTPGSPSIPGVAFSESTPYTSDSTGDSGSFSPCVSSTDSSISSESLDVPEFPSASLGKTCVEAVDESCSLQTVNSTMRVAKAVALALLRY
ncbi:hypothetical protein OF83DRAFT_1084411 [Amylostereum chailletii]|nr:hypothetical protein OF83DRAFT_1084411 [Amylostereum chailletii]